MIDWPLWLYDVGENTLICGVVGPLLATLGFWLLYHLFDRLHRRRQDARDLVRLRALEKEKFEEGVRRHAAACIPPLPSPTYGRNDWRRDLQDPDLSIDDIAERVRKSGGKNGTWRRA